ncbi:MAG: M23 family metallopeptidase [Bacilli bacterium]
MKKGLLIISIIILSLSIFWLGFDYRKSDEPNIYYQVFLDGDLVGVVTSKSKLEKYINGQNEYIKNKYKVTDVYSPNGLEIEKIVTYSSKADKISDVYNKIKNKKAFTIKGFQMTIKDGEKSQVIYATNSNVFVKALESTIETFVGKDNYKNYINKSQKKIVETGKIIENVYIENTKTIKETFISTDELIYTNSEDLNQYFIFGKKMQKNSYIVKPGDTIESIAFDNKISVEEFLLSNDNITNSKNLLFAGQTVSIAVTDPQIKVVVEEYVIEDVLNKHKTIEQYDANRPIGNNQVIQYGADGIDRVSKDVKRTNGAITYVNTQSKIEAKPTINQIIVIGQKYIPTIGSLTVWAWPTAGGWTISSGYGYRINPINGARELHDGIDIAGTGYNSPIYAANNGIVVTASYGNVNGNFVVINHNNGYYTYYGHMTRYLVQKGQTVARGEQIGLIGSTGWATGPHLHFGVFYGFPYYGGYSLNPWSIYK